MGKKRQLTPEEVTELFSEVDASGVIDPARVKTRKKRLMSWRAARSAGDEEAEERLTAEDRRSRTGSTVDPLSDEDPSGSKVGNTIPRFGVAFIVGIIVLVVGMQVGYGVMRRLNTANLSDTVNTETVSRAIEGGLEWGNGFTQFPSTFTVDEADERTGVVEVSVVSTDASNELELFSNSQIEAAALATNALLNDNINRVVYNVSAVMDEDGNIVSDGLFSFFPVDGTERQIFTFIWTKNMSEASSNIDWELRIVGMDEEVASRIQKQVNSVSSLIDTPSVDQSDIEAQEDELALEQSLKGKDVFLGADDGQTLRDALSAAQNSDATAAQQDAASGDSSGQ